MKNRFIASTLVLLIVFSILPVPSMAESGLPNDVAIRDYIRFSHRNVHFFELATWNVPNNENVFFYTFDDIRTDFSRMQVARVYDKSDYTEWDFVLYENGDLYLRDTPEGNFVKLASGVKKIDEFTVPYYRRKIHPVNKSFVLIADIDCPVVSILYENGTLSVIGAPEAVPTQSETRSLTFYGEESKKSTSTEATISYISLLPWELQPLPKVIQRLAENVEWFEVMNEHSNLRDGVFRVKNGRDTWLKVPNANPKDDDGREYYNDLDTIIRSRMSSVAFFSLKNGEKYTGLLGTQNLNRLSDTVLKAQTYGSDRILFLNENGNLADTENSDDPRYKDIVGRSLFYKAQVEKYFSEAPQASKEFPLFDFGFIMELYKTFNSAVGFIYENELYSIDLKPGTKVMEDVKAILDDRQVVLMNGDVYSLSFSAIGGFERTLLLKGNGIEPNPLPPYYEGRVFRNASGWALPDLRTAREADLTLPVASLDYSQPITREKFAEVAVKLYEKLSGKKAQPASNVFTDTKNPEILKAYALGIVAGTSPSTFSPKDQITREQIALMLMRTVKKAGVTLKAGQTKNFSDLNQVAGWARDAVIAMANANIVRGTSKSTFDPKAPATVEQAVIMANRLLK